MRREAARPFGPIDDDPLFDLPRDWLLSDFRAGRRESEVDGWLRSLASDVTLLSRKDWPAPRERSPGRWKARARVREVAKRGLT